MDSIFVTLQDGDRRVDLKVPVFVTVEELLQMLQEALPLTVSKEQKLQAEPLGRFLDNRKTLEEEAVTHGSLLTLI